MITEVTGDILLSGAEAIAHGVAPNDNFSSGLALSLREHWPALYKDFRHYCQTYRPEPGEVWTWVNADGIRIINLMTQAAAYEQGQKPGRASIENVNHALKSLRKLLIEENISSLALPRLATGVGGLAWEDVLPVIHSHLGDLKIPVYLYTLYHKGMKANEA